VSISEAETPPLETVVIPSTLFDRLSNNILHVSTCSILSGAQDWNKMR